ncbi:hypothetical protein KAR48_02970 [bacterium]|nr:hypothetical protein [bacterium]
MRVLFFRYMLNRVGGVKRAGASRTKTTETHKEEQGSMGRQGFKRIITFCMVAYAGLIAQIPEITVYGNGGCGNCIKVRRILTGAGIKFTYHDVSQNKAADEAMMEHLERGGLSGETIQVPVIATESIYLNGALDKWLENLEELKSAPRVDLFGYRNHDVSMDLFRQLKKHNVVARFHDLSVQKELDDLLDRHGLAGLATHISYPVITVGDRVFNDGRNHIITIMEIAGVSSDAGVSRLDATPKNKHVADREAAAINLLHQYSPEAYALILAAHSSPGYFETESRSIDLGDADRLANWLEGNTVEEIVRELNLAVHEIIHDYINRIGWKAGVEAGDNFDTERRYFAFPLKKDQHVVVSCASVVVTDEMHDIVEKRHQGDRYETYIYPSVPEMTTQQFGVYGLIDELCAYYWGSRVSLNVYDFYVGHPSVDGTNWLDWISDVASTLAAYGEFRLYIFYYLDYVRLHYPAAYRKIISDNEFILAFTVLDQNFESLTVMFEEKQNSIIKHLSLRGLECYIQDNAFFIGLDGISTFKREQDLFLEACAASRFNAVREALNPE